MTFKPLFMISLYWNITGIANPPSRLALKRLIIIHKPHFLFIAESKINLDKIFNHCFFKLGFKLFATSWLWFLPCGVFVRLRFCRRFQLPRINSLVLALVSSFRLYVNKAPFGPPFYLFDFNINYIKVISQFHFLKAQSLPKDGYDFF